MDLKKQPIKELDTYTLNIKGEEYQVEAWFKVEISNGNIYPVQLTDKEGFKVRHFTQELPIPGANAICGLTCDETLVDLDIYITCEICSEKSSSLKGVK